jgi:hypothetical protein
VVCTNVRRVTGGIWESLMGVLLESGSKVLRV